MVALNKLEGGNNGDTELDDSKQEGENNDDTELDDSSKERMNDSGFSTQ